MFGGRVEKTTEVDVVTLDGFGAAQGIESISILKSDTQGYEYEVFRGAEGLMKGNRIALVYFEVIFSEQYQGLPPFHELFAYLLERNFALVALYPPFMQEDLAGWGDALFINREWNARRLAQRSGGGGRGRST